MKKPISFKKEQSLYIETAKQKVAEVLFKHPESEFSLSDLAKEAGVRKSNIGKILDDFHKQGLIEITKLSNIWRIRANQRSQLFLRNKIVYNLSMIHQTGLTDALIEAFQNPKAIILFGSYRLGEDIADSDIDIAIETAAEEYKALRLKELASFEKVLERNIQIHLFNRKAADLNLFNNIANGIVLWGFLEVNP